MSYPAQNFEKITPYLEQASSLTGGREAMINAMFSLKCSIMCLIRWDDCELKRIKSHQSILKAKLKAKLANRFVLFLWCIYGCFCYCLGQLHLHRSELSFKTNIILAVINYIHQKKRDFQVQFLDIMLLSMPVI